MSDANNDSDASVQQSGEQPPAMPRWVKVTIIVACALLLVLVLLKVTGLADRHGPGMHQSGTPDSGHALALTAMRSGR